MEKENQYIKKIKPHLIVVSFRAVAMGMLKGVMIPNAKEGRTMHISEDGTVYLNNESEFYRPLLFMFLFLMEQPKYKLSRPELYKQFIKRCKLKDYPELKSAFQSILNVEQERRKLIEAINKNKRKVKRTWLI